MPKESQISSSAQRDVDCGFVKLIDVVFCAPEKSSMSATFLCTHQTSIVRTLSAQNSSERM